MTVIFLMSINVLMCQYITSEGEGGQMLPSKGSAELYILLCLLSQPSQGKFILHSLFWRRT